MTAREMRKAIHALMLKHNTDMVSLPADTALRVGIEYVTFKGAKGIQGISFDEELVKISDNDVEDIYNAVRKELKEVRLYQLSREEVEGLCRQIVMGSLYVADYENTFGVDEREVLDYADGYLEAKENPEEFGEYETFYDYIQSTEY